VTALVALAGAAATAGVLLVLAGLVGVSDETVRRWRPRTRRPTRVGAAGVVGAGAGRDGAGYRRWALRLAAPLLALLATGWPVAALLAAAAAVGLPRLLGGRRAAEVRIARLQGLADWTRRLADVLGAGAGLEQALQASVRTVPGPISVEVGALAARLHARHPVAEALRGFADDLDDPVGDLVVAALLLAAGRRGRGLARVLTGLAGTVEAEVAMRRGVEADRAQPRTTARWVCYISLAVAAGLFVFNPSYVAPFGTPTGQAVLLAVGSLFAGAFVWMHRLTSATPGERFLPLEGANSAPAGSGSR
jgi:Flp pilus assembly protein TadB